MIRKLFITLFNVSPNEVRIVFWLIFQSVFLGIFVGTYDIAAHSLFIEEFGDKLIPQAYVFSGILGIVTTFIYSQLQKYVKFSSLSIFNLVFISLATISIRLLFDFSTDSIAIYTLFIFFGPLNILAILGFWGLANRIFTLRQGKRLFGIIDSGLIIGVILSSAAIPILPALFGFTPKVKDLVSVSGIFVLLATLIQLRILRLKVVKSVNLEPIKAKKAKTKKVNLVRNRYLLFMSLFVGLSMVVAFFIQFIFLATTEKQYESSADFALFFAQFTLAMMIVTLIIKTFVYNRLIKTYGLKVTLLILPFLLIAILIGVNILSYTTNVSEVESSGFMLFFILIALGRLLSNALKSGLEVPAFKLLYHSLDSEIKYDAQARIDGVVNEISAVCSGLLLTGLALIFTEPIHFVYVLVGILGLWIIVTFYLYKHYRNALAQTDIVVDKKTVDSIEYLIQNKSKEFSPFFKGIVSAINPLFLGQQKQTPEKIKLANYSYNILSDKINSFDDLEIQEALDYIEYHKNREFIPLLLNLIKSPSDDIKFQAILVSEKYDDPAINALLVENLRHSKFKQIIYSILCHRKMNIIPQIQYQFDASTSTFEYQRDLIELAGIIETPEAIDFLRAIYHRTNPRLVDLAISKLAELGHQEEKDTETLVRITKERLEIACWNLVVQLNLNEREHKEIYHIFEKQIAKDRLIIFDVLSLIHERSMLKRAQENFELNTLEGTEMSLELMDMLLDDSMKPLVNVYFEEYSPKEKINRIADYFPIENINEENVIDMISKRDIRFLNHNIIALSILNHFGSLSNVSLLKAHFYNPTYSIRETVHFILKNYFTEHYNELIRRMRVNDRKQYFVDVPEDTTGLVSYKFSKLMEMESLKELDFDHFGILSAHVNNKYVDHIEVYFDFENDLIIPANKITEDTQAHSFSLDRKNLFELAGDQQFLRFLVLNDGLA